MPTKWEFYDPTVPETYTWDINPREGGAPQYEKNIVYQSTTAPDGKTLVYEGQDAPQELEWSGVILEQDQYDTLLSWYQKRRQVRLTDDLGRVYWVYIKTFNPQRQRSANYVYKHEYTMTAVILEWA